jgi:hypothetical protein
MDQERLSKLAGIKEDWKDEEFSAKGREADEKSMQAAQDRYDARQNKPEINPGDEVVNHLNDIEESISTINHDNLSEMAMRIQDAVEEIRNKLDKLGWEQYD